MNAFAIKIVNVKRKPRRFECEVCADQRVVQKTYSETGGEVAYVACPRCVKAIKNPAV